MKQILAHVSELRQLELRSVSTVVYWLQWVHGPHRYRSDLIAEGAVFGEEQDVAGEANEGNAAMVSS